MSVCVCGGGEGVDGSLFGCVILLISVVVLLSSRTCIIRPFSPEMFRTEVREKQIRSPEDYLNHRNVKGF